jgi:hypothetical protein
MGDKDVDAQFADIVAHWDEVESLPDPEPRADDVAPGEDEATGPGATRSAVNPPLEPDTAAVNPPPVRPFVVWRGAEAADEEETPPELAEVEDVDEEHFVPGPLAPLPPQEDIQFWGIIVGLVAGPLLLLWLVLFRPNVSDWWTFGALALTAGGFVLLVLRQPHSRDEDDPDNGARV